MIFNSLILLESVMIKKWPKTTSHHDFQMTVKEIEKFPISGIYMVPRFSESKLYVPQNCIV